MKFLLMKCEDVKTDVRIEMFDVNKDFTLMNTKFLKQSKFHGIFFTE